MTDNNPQSAENGVARWLVLRRREDLAPELPNAAIDDGWSRKSDYWLVDYVPGSVFAGSRATQRQLRFCQVG